MCLCLQNLKIFQPKSLNNSKVIVNNNTTELWFMTSDKNYNLDMLDDYQI